MQVGGQTYEVPADAGDAHISSALNAIPAANAPNAPKARTWTDVAVDAIPAVTGTAGAILGGTTGTAFGMGLGGLPGVAGGAALGTAAGEALKQGINRYRGAHAPATPGEAAAQIAIPAAIAGVSTGALGAATSFAAPRAGDLMVKAGETLAKSPSWRQLAGQALQTLGETLKPETVTAVAPKLALTANDVLRIKSMTAAGLPEADALKHAMSMKMQQAIAAAAAMK